MVSRLVVIRLWIVGSVLWAVGVVSIVVREIVLVVSVALIRECRFKCCCFV